MNWLIVISAPSGTGKTTLCSKLLNEIPTIKLSVSSTTRAPRGKEKNGIEYFFIDKPEFEKKIKENRFAEWALVHENYYGTSKDFIEKTFASGNSVLLDIDVQGADQLKKSYPEKTFTIFVMPPSMEVLEKRLRSRGTDTEETIQKRLKNAAKEMAQKDRFDSVIINDDLNVAYIELKKTVSKKISESSS